MLTTWRAWLSLLWIMHTASREAHSLNTPFSKEWNASVIFVMYHAEKSKCNEHNLLFRLNVCFFSRTGPHEGTSILGLSLPKSSPYTQILRNSNKIWTKPLNQCQQECQCSKSKLCAFTRYWQLYKGKGSLKSSVMQGRPQINTRNLGIDFELASGESCMQIFFILQNALFRYFC